ncbi:hypothetical protein SHIRM173S_05727 [Streptomyces hirsutus]
MRLGAQEVAVPDAQQAQQQRHVGLGRGGAEVVVDEVEPVEHLPEAVRADGDHQRQADRRVVRVASADPVPELEHVRRVDAEVGDLLRVRREGDEVLGDGDLSPVERVQQPGPCGSGVGDRLDGGERLGRDDEQRLGRVQVADGLVQVGAEARWVLYGSVRGGSGGFSRSWPAGKPQRGQSHVSGTCASLAKLGWVSCPLEHQKERRSRGADSPRSASPIGPAPTRLPRIALPLATVVTPCVMARRSESAFRFAASASVYVRPNARPVIGVTAPSPDASPMIGRAVLRVPDMGPYVGNAHPMRADRPPRSSARINPSSS